MAAVIFDLDGTLVDSERHGHRVAFNLAFESFDLPYRWDEDTYGELLRITGGRRRIDHYLRGQNVAADERERLAQSLHECKTEIMTRLVDEGRVETRPGVTRLLADLQERGCRLAVATTGSRGWVERLLARLLAVTRFEVIVTGDEVETRKPDPEAFTVALRRLGLGAAEAVAVEDSAEGLQAAQGAGLACAMVVNGYTRDHDLARADLVLDGFGEPGRPAQVLADRRDTDCDGILDADVLSSLLPD